MANLSLRESHELGIQKIHQLDAPAVAELGSALKSVEPMLRRAALAEAVALRVNLISRDDVDKIVSTLAGLYAVATSADVDLQTFVDDVCDAMHDSDTNPLLLSEDEQHDLKSRLIALIDNKAVFIAAKALSVFVEHEHYLCYARIMTDVRPIFGPDPTEKPTAAMIVHTLKIAYHDGDDTKEFFVALDSGSLDRLQDLIDRAKAKQDALKNVLTTSDVRYVDTE